MAKVSTRLGQLEQDLYDLVGAVQGAKRQDVKDQVSRLAEHLGSSRDFLEDRRRAAWAPGGRARQTVEARTNFLATWRGGGSAEVTLEQAAEIVKRTVGSLRVLLNQGGGKYHAVIDDEVITISRRPKDD